MRRVVITGMGGLSPIGHSWPEIEQALRRYRNNVRYMPEWEIYSGLNSRLGSALPPFQFPAHYTRKRIRGMGRVAQLATRSSELALEAAGLLDDPILTSGRTGVAYGSSSGSPPALSDMAKLLVTESTDSIKAKLGSAVLDTAMTLREGPPGRYTMVVALGLPDAKELSAWIGENWSVYKETGFLRKLAKPSNYRGLRVFSGWPAISSEGVLASVFGEEPMLSIGVGKDIVYLVFGENGPRALREARDAVSGGGVSPKPLDVRMDLGLLLELFSGFDRSRLATFISRQLGDDTRLRASMRAVSGGVGLRMEFGPGFVPFLGSVLSNEIFPAPATPSGN